MALFLFHFQSHPLLNNAQPLTSLQIPPEFCREPPRYSFLWKITITLTLAEIYEEKPFLISGAENVLVTDVGAKEVEKVKTKEEEADVELEGELGKTDLNVKSELGGVLHGTSCSMLLRPGWK